MDSLERIMYFVALPALGVMAIFMSFYGHEWGQFAYALHLIAGGIAIGLSVGIAVGSSLHDRHFGRALARDTRARRRSLNHFKN